MPKKKRNHVEKGTWSLGAIDRLLAFSVYSYVYARIPISPFFFTVLTLSNNRCSIGNFSQLTSILPIFHWSCIYFWKKKKSSTGAVVRSSWERRPVGRSHEEIGAVDQRQGFQFRLWNQKVDTDQTLDAVDNTRKWYRPAHFPNLLPLITIHLIEGLLITINKRSRVSGWIM